MTDHPSTREARYDYCVAREIDEAGLPHRCRLQTPHDGLHRCDCDPPLQWGYSLATPAPSALPGVREPAEPTKPTLRVGRIVTVSAFGPRGYVATMTEYNADGIPGRGVSGDERPTAQEAIASARERFYAEEKFAPEEQINAEAAITELEGEGAFYAAEKVRQLAAALSTAHATAERTRETFRVENRLRREAEATAERTRELEQERVAVMEALGIDRDEEDGTYWVLGKFAAHACTTLVEAAKVAREAPEKAWYRHVGARNASEGK